jgi:single-strand DNA-binding protein
LDHNRVHLIGRLVKAPQFFPPGRKGQEHCTFSIAVNRVVPNEEGPTADYLPCSLWGPEATRFCETRDKGDEVGILGRIRTNFVPQASGDKKFFWEIRVEHVEYGRRALKNLRAAPRQETVATQAVRSLNREFGE